MKRVLFLFLGLSIIIAGCCSSASCQKTTSGNSTTVISSPTTVGKNKSVVTATIVERFSSASGEYVLKLKIDTVSENDAYPSLARPGEIYTALPAFIYQNDGQKEPNERNTRLEKLGTLQNGASVSLTLYFESNKGWFIEDYNNN